MFLRPRAGMRAIVDALLATLGDRVRTGAEAIRADDRRIELATGAEPCDAVVLAGGAAAAASVLGDRAPDDLRAMRAVSTGVVFLVYPSGTAAALPDGSGAVVPRGRAPMTAATFLSRKWPDDRFGDRAVLRASSAATATRTSSTPTTPTSSRPAVATSRPRSIFRENPRPPTSIGGGRGCPSTSSATSIASDGSGALAPGIFVVGNAFDGVGVSGPRAAAETAARVTDREAVPRKEPA